IVVCGEVNAVIPPRFQQPWQPGEPAHCGADHGMPGHDSRETIERREDAIVSMNTGRIEIIETVTLVRQCIQVGGEVAIIAITLQVVGTHAFHEHHYYIVIVLRLQTDDASPDRESACR